MWEKVAEQNLPLMVNYLSKVALGTNADQAFSKKVKKPLQTENRIQQLLDEDRQCNWNETPQGGETLSNGKTLMGTKWDILKQKLILVEERRVKQAAGCVLHRSDET